MADIRELENELYKTSGIYYYADEANIFQGYACIFGPKDSCYENTPMIYKFNFPQSYPFDPPTVTFLTHDGKTRFHPNMYIEGKVCLSILHTWQGPKWASTMKISTVLVTLQSLMDTDPLRHEPGYEVGRESLCKAYANAVKASCINYQLQCLEKPITQDSNSLFKDLILEKLSKSLETLEKMCESLDLQETQLPYVMKCLYTKEDLMKRVLKLKD